MTITATDIRTRLLAAIDDRRDELVALTRDLIRIPTMNPPGECYREICEYLANRLRSRGFEIQLLTLGRRRDLEGCRAVPFSLSEPQQAIEAIRDFGATSFVMAGGVSISDLARERLRSFFSGKAATIGDTGLSRLTDDLATLTWLANLAALELHAPMARADDLGEQAAFRGRSAIARADGGST